MKIAGLQKNSFVDYPGHIVAVVFTPGCNMDCFYCHNRSILYDSPFNDISPCYRLMDIDKILSFLEGRKNLLDGVVISGGEPTIQSNLEDFIMQVKCMGYPLKLDTNGTNPQIIEHFIESELVDYIAMDIKAPPSKYKDICGVYVDINKIMDSIDILMSSDIQYEFRTTFAPALDEEDILDIAHIIKGARLYVLQQFRKNEYMTKYKNASPHTPQYINQISEKVQNLVPCITRGI